MRNIYSANNPLKNETMLYVVLLGVFWLVSFCILVVFEVLDIFQYFGMPYVICIGITSSIFGKKIKINLNGIRGEKVALRSVRKLGNEYSAFVNMKLEYEEQSSEVDLIVVGPKGIFVCEVKNHNGEIQGRPDDKRWVQIKKTEKGGKFYNGFYNPCKQVKTHTYRLSQILKDDGYEGWIQSSVYFVNENATLKIQKGKVPVIGPNSSLKQFIEEYEPKHMLTKEEIEKVLKIIFSHIESKGK